MERFRRLTISGLQRLISWLLLIGYVGSARAADFSVMKGPDGGQSVVISGQIELGDDEKFAGVASSLESATVWLQSPGGSTLAALNIGTAIRLKLWRTIVPQGTTCASACALIWLAGTERSVGISGRVGFHASYVVKAGVPMETGAANALVGAYLNKLGLRDSAVIYVTSTAPTSITWLTANDAKAVSIKAVFDTSDIRPTTDNTPKHAAISPLGGPATGKPDSQTDGPTTLSDNKMMASLYRSYPASIALHNYKPCLQGGCSIALRKIEKWIGQDGKNRQLVVAVVKQEMGNHIDGGILGIAVFRWDYVTWVPEISMPAVMSIGSFGNYSGEIKVLHPPGMDPVLIAHNGDMHQGVIDETDSILINVFGTYKEVLNVYTGTATGGYCDNSEAWCIERIRNGDFQSEVSVTAAVGGGLNVLQTFSSGLHKAPKTWQIEPNGKVRDTSSPATPISEAVLPAVTASYASGVSDRQAYEAWFATLTGDAKDGATFWAAQRSLRSPPSCIIVNPLNAAWTAGCVSATQRLSASDAKRKLDADYKRGWNSL